MIGTTRSVTQRRNELERDVDRAASTPSTRSHESLRVFRDCLCSTQDLDAINEPYRPIPSGRITRGGGLPASSPPPHCLGVSRWPLAATSRRPQHHRQSFEFCWSVGLLRSVSIIPLQRPTVQAQGEGEWRGSFALGASYMAAAVVVRASNVRPRGRRGRWRGINPSSGRTHGVVLAGGFGNCDCE